MARLREAQQMSPLCRAPSWQPTAARCIACKVFPTLSWIAAALLAGCNGGDSHSLVKAPGGPASARTALLDAGAAALQAQAPIRAIDAYLDGFHFRSGQMQQQMEAHHYCSNLNEEVIQCALFDGNLAEAKLTGVEYIISARLFATLPPAEKPLWHSHVHEVKSGQLIAPAIPAAAEHALMEKLVGTYGKTWHTWHTDMGDKLPLGVPQLMMGFTGDGQARPELVTERDERFHVDSHELGKSRADIHATRPDPAADGWMNGEAFQLADPTRATPAAR
jgi:hypothetical protein